MWKVRVSSKGIKITHGSKKKNSIKKKQNRPLKEAKSK